jgi:hypothetical protein
MSTFQNPLTEYSPQQEGFEYGESEQDFGGAIFSESEEMELTGQMLGIASEQELDRFLGDLINKAGSAIGGFVKRAGTAIGDFAQSPTGQAIGGVLKGVAKQALPIAGGALGAYFGGPLGAQIGSGLASMAGQTLGLELEGLSPEDKEFEATRQFVRFAGDTVKNALQAPPTADPTAVANAAAAEAARIHAPGLLSGAPGTMTPSGCWVRRHGTIVLYGI